MEDSMSFQPTSARPICLAAFVIFLLILSAFGANAQIPYQIRIDTLSGAPFGSAIAVPVIKETGSIDMAGFDLVIRYDTLGLDFVDITPGPIFTTPGGWEYFNYRHELTGDSAAGIPPGWLRIIGIYDILNGSIPANLDVPDGTTLFILNFTVTPDSSLECHLFPLRFFWFDCGDNTISNTAGTVLYVSDHVYDPENVEITDTLSEFPTYSGAPNECVVPEQPKSSTRFINLYNGAVEIDCPQNQAIPFRVEIDVAHGIALGSTVEVPVIKNAGSELMDGFDILMGYETTVLTLTDVFPGPAFNDPDGWEYFSWRSDTGAGCGYGCPSGLVRVVGVYDINNAHVPTNQDIPDGTKLFGLNFSVTNDVQYECMFIPVSFFWMDCGDNAIALNDGNVLALSNQIYNVFGTEISDTNAMFPTFFGSPSECYINPGNPVRFIDFVNGGVDIACDSTIDNRGDINLNGIAYEIADYVVFTNYFLYGLPAFTINVDAQIAATDINADGLPLTINDIVFLIRIIEGEALPYPSPAKINSYDFAGSLNLLQTDSSIMISADFEDSVGGLFLSFSAPDLNGYDGYSIEVSPEIENMDVGYIAENGIFNILITKLRQFPNSASAVIPAGPINLIEIVYTGSQPILSQAATAGYMGRYVDLTVSAGYLCGDANGNGSINLLDILYIINYLYKSGLAPISMEKADINGDGNVNILDITYFIQYLYKAGPALQCQ